MSYYSMEKVFQIIKSGDRIVTSMAAAEPSLFFSKLHQLMEHVSPLTVHCANPTQNYPCFSQATLRGNLELEIMFLTRSIINEQGKNRIHYVPQHLSQWSQNLQTRGPIDIFWGSCTPPDEKGFVSLGTGCCYESEILKLARVVILEVNKNMPYVYGDTRIHTSLIHYLLENNHPLPTSTVVPISNEDKLIAQYISSLISDESTLQLGIGSIPNAVGQELKYQKNLGIHTEIITESMMTLMKNGVVTNSKKTLHTGKTIGSFIFGSTELYQFVHENKLIELYPSSYVNKHGTLAQNKKMTSINTAIEIDLTGQVCSESLGHKEISGVGGASDTHIGAQQSEGGRGIVAIRSAPANLSYSKIVFELKPGAKVSISRNDVDTVVTEYGIAHLKGYSVSQRAQSLIRIAHPNFREQLKAQAQKEGYL